MRKASDLLIAKVKEFEGYRSVAYKCAAGVFTIGFGHTKRVKAGQTCTKAMAEEWLREDLATAERACNNIPELDTQGRFDSCVDFIFNLGLGSFLSSTLYKKIKAKATTADIQKEFRRWVYAGGKKLDGLVKRREWEAERWADTGDGMWGK